MLHDMLNHVFAESVTGLNRGPGERTVQRSHLLPG